MKSGSVLLQNKFLFCVSLLFSICGLAFTCLWSVIFDSLLTLREGSLLYKYWKDIPVELKTDFYFFNWTNPEDFYNLSAKPRFEEIGPYTFWQSEKKVNISWNDNGTVTFRVEKYWRYESGNLNDTIVTMNPVPVGASYILRNWNYFIKKGIFIALHPIFRNLQITKTVGELLFEGYPEPLIKIARAIPLFAKHNFPNWDRFGWVYSRNGSSEFEGTFTMGTGVNSTFGQIDSWSGYQRTPFFNSPCNEVYGSAGQFFERNLKKDSVKVFSTDLRRSVNLTFDREEIVAGVVGYRYIVDDRLLDNGTIYPENRCFCNGDCLPSGMLNLSNTRHGYPLFLSLPHFYRADPYYANLIDGVKPDSNIDEFSVTIEPITGIPVKADAKIQASFFVQPIPGVLMFETAPKFMLPVIWTRQTFEIEGLYAVMLWILVNFSVICISIGISMVMLSLGTFSFITYKRHLAYLRQQKRLEFLKEQNIPLKTEFIQR
ncbi:protein peste-like [Zophobas morio]|uniref:protein peste-like n=1 Tax=Zophobas morio TaxID=2755281 RepID=UPI003083B369